MQNEKKCCAEIIKKAIEKWGNELQTVVCMEECSELIEQCILISATEGNDKATLAEEIADVYICFALKVYRACEKSRRERQAKQRYANYIANSYHYAVVDKAMKRGGWRKR